MTESQPENGFDSKGVLDSGQRNQLTGESIDFGESFGNTKSQRSVAPLAVRQDIGELREKVEQGGKYLPKILFR
jgi:hypothetical protein